MEDKELLADFVVEAKEHLADIENQFLKIEENGAEIDIDLINDVFRAIHSIKGAAGFLGLSRVNDLAHNLENILNMMRNRELSPTPAIVNVMLRAADTLVRMIDDVENSNSVDVSDHIVELAAVQSGAASEVAVAAESEDIAGCDSTLSGELPLAAAAPSAPVDSALVAESVVAAAPAPEARQAASPVAPAPPAGAAKNEERGAATPHAEANIRVPVGVLDSLMNLAGELVLGRNQLLQAIGAEEKSGLDAIAARLDQVTSELQEAIMQTRMQQIGSVFGRFPRVVRDLSAKLGKQCDLEIEGKEVEVDKTIVEAIGDPLTHLVRNSIDHGIESPEERVRKGKPAKGMIHMRAFYQAGKVRIDITDDGAGIDPARLKEKAVSKGILTPERAEQMSDREAIRLIFHPGFSTAKQVTDVSGRGVGMDVVRTNIAKLGGTVDVESVVGAGASVIVTLPLTLAIIPSLIVKAGADRFAIPQVNIVELVRLRENEREQRLGRVKDAEVLRLRGALLPLIRLSEALELAPAAGRANEAVDNATNIIVVDSGQTRFGLIVDALFDSEEIVVKPLGRHHKNARCLAGATILGGGHVALILDVAGLAGRQDLGGAERSGNAADATVDEGESELQTMLLFQNHSAEHFAAPMDIVARLERIPTNQLDSVGGREVLQYRGGTLPVLRLDALITARKPEPTESVYVVVFEIKGREVGLVAPVLRDIRDIPTNIDTSTFVEEGVIGSLVVDKRTTRIVDLFELARKAHPEWFKDAEAPVAAGNGLAPLILLAEDSGFFLSQVTKMFEEQGYRVEPCEDGLVAWEKLRSDEYEVDIVVTDIEMPNMNGFDLCRRIKDHPKLRHLPVVALTSLAASGDVQRGMDVGIDDYQIKMDRDKLLAAIRNFVDHDKTRNAKNKRQPVGAKS